MSRYQAFVDESFLLATIAFLNASTCTALLRMSSDWFSRPKFIVGIVQPLPVPNLASSRSELASLGRRAWSLKRSLDAGVEVSHAFRVASAAADWGDSLAARVEGWSRRARAVGLELDEIQAEMDERAFDLYGIAEADRRAISEGFASGGADFDAEEPGGEPDEADDEGGC